MLSPVNESSVNSIDYQDRMEYITAMVLIQTVNDFKSKGQNLTVDDLVKFRNEWQMNEAPVDFSKDFPELSDFESLLRGTGAESFGRLDNYDSLEEGISALIDSTSKDYDKYVANGQYIHTCADPVIREHIIDPNSSTANKSHVFYIHEGHSARELNPDEEVTLRVRGSNDVAVAGNVIGGTYIARESDIGTVVNPSLVEEASVQSEQASESATQTAQTTQTETQEDEEFEIQSERLMGWEGGKDEHGRELRGLSQIIGAYLTKADGKIAAQNIDPNQEFDGDLAYNSADLLQHMRSEGHDFKVGYSQDYNQISVELLGSSNLNVRAFDSDSNGRYIGRVYDKFNQYYYYTPGAPSQQAKVEFDSNDSIELLEYALGNSGNGDVNEISAFAKSLNSDGANVIMVGSDNKKQIHINADSTYYRALVFADEDEAQEYLEQAIVDTQEHVNEEFKADEIQTLIDEGLEDDDVLVSSDEFKNEFEALYSKDDIIRAEQEAIVEEMRHSSENGDKVITSQLDEFVGSYDSGFNPAVVLEFMRESGRGNERDAMMSALKVSGYDTSILKGNDFAVDSIKERIVKFDPETAKTIDEIEHPMMKRALETVQDTLMTAKLRGPGDAVKNREPEVRVDDNGIIEWKANRRLNKNKQSNWQEISGEIGQIMVPDEHGIINTQFENDNNYGIVPGHTGYFAFDGDYDDRMSRFRAKGFEEHLHSDLRSVVTHQSTRPYIDKLGNIPSTLDSSSVNGLYHGDVYGKRIESDFMETNQLDTETKEAILTTLSQRVRFDNQYSDYATTGAETQASREKGMNQDDIGAFSYWKSVGEKNMRVLDKDLENYADTMMTGTGKTQGLVWYLTDGSVVNEDGSITPSEGILQEDGTYAPDKSAVSKLPYFDQGDFNAWDRNQMSANQLLTGLRVDEAANTAMISFGGWTFDDSYAVSKEFADRNQVFGENPNEHSMDTLEGVIVDMANNKSKEDALDGTNMMWSDAVLAEGEELRMDEFLQGGGRHEAYTEFLEEHGRFRSLQRGDKLSDFGGNKGTIGIVIDREMSDSDIEKEDIHKEVAFMKANPELDVITAPYSMLSRHNAGIIHELMGDEDTPPQDLVDPDTNDVYEGAMGKLNILITDMIVDDKTQAYSEADVADGKGRKASGQLAWAIQSKGAEGIMNEIYGHNDNAWETYREYLISTGMDMEADGTIVQGYSPHADEERNHFAYDPDVESHDFLNNIKDTGGFLDLPFDVEFKNGLESNEMPLLSGSLRQNVELVDGTMRRSDFTNDYEKIYNELAKYDQAESDFDKKAIQEKVQESFNKVQDTIIDRQIDGGHNGKNSYMRDNIMGKRMKNSATAVAIVDPRLDIGEAGMTQEMMDSLEAEEGDTVMMFRDPVWRDGAIRSMTVKHDETAHGVAFNPISDKSHDGDFDGDTMGLIKLDSKEALHDLKTKFSHEANMIDKGDGKDSLYFQDGMDLRTADIEAEEKGDKRPAELYEKATTVALEGDRTGNMGLNKRALKHLNDYAQIQFRENSFGGDYINLTNDETVFESIHQMSASKGEPATKDKPATKDGRGTKGGPQALPDYKEYHLGKRDDTHARDIQYATGVKTDDTGLAGANSQKAAALMRNINISSGLEATYPISQGTLQIKHNPVHARIVNDVLSNDMMQLFNGKDIKSRNRDGLTPDRFKSQIKELYGEDKLDVDVADEHIDSLSDALTHKGKILPMKEAMRVKASPMDRVAYGGGYEELQVIAKEGRSLLEGEQSKQFSPFSMRNSDENTKIAKKDTQKIELVEQEVEEVIETSVDVDSKPKPTVEVVDTKTQPVLSEKQEVSDKSIDEVKKPNGMNYSKAVVKPKIEVEHQEAIQEEEEEEREEQLSIDFADVDSGPSL